MEKANKLLIDWLETVINEEPQQQIRADTMDHIVEHLNVVKELKKDEKKHLKIIQDSLDFLTRRLSDLHQENYQLKRSISRLEDLLPCESEQEAHSVVD